MSTTGKSIRDGVLPTGIGSFVGGIVLHYTGDAYLAGLAAVVTGAVVAAAYRVIRARWPWLAALDPGAQQLANRSQIVTPNPELGTTTASSATTPPQIGGTSAGA